MQVDTMAVFSSLLLLILLFTVTGNPSSNPYIVYRTSPFDQDGHIDHKIDWKPDLTVSTIQPVDTNNNAQCPLQFVLGISKRLHGEVTSIRQPPVLYPVFPARGPGRQVLYSTIYEHLDVLSPALLETPSSNGVKEALLQPSDFPLLLESSSFRTSPLIHDVTGDGRAKAIVTDYEGGIHVVGLTLTPTQPRYVHTAQVPRLFVRREWIERRIQRAQGIVVVPPTVEGVNASNHTDHTPDDPYHSYFEYYYSRSDNPEKLLQGVSANLLNQDASQVQALQERRRRRNKYQDKPILNREYVHDAAAAYDYDDPALDDLQVQDIMDRREQMGRVPEGQEDQMEAENADEPVKNEVHRRLEEITPEEHDARMRGEGHPKDLPPEVAVPLDRHGDRRLYDDTFDGEEGTPRDQVAKVDHDDPAVDDPGYGMHYDDYYGRRGGDHDDMYTGHNTAHREYYDTKHYIRVPPHVLCTPVLAELPRLYSNNNEKEDILFVAVSYYLDEDEYEGLFSYKRFENTDMGDETEVQRGTFVASAIMAYILGDSPRWSGQTHLDLSTDYSSPENATLLGVLPVQSDVTRMGAFALSSPTVADIDGDGQLELLVGTSMGIVYAFDARQIYKKSKWPIQMRAPVESRILVEDVVGDTNLEIFVADIACNVACLSHEANLIWNRDVTASLGLEAGSIIGSSPMTLGDIDGDGVLDLVMTVQSRDNAYLIALNAATGSDISHFPINLGAPERKSEDIGADILHDKLPQPLLVDLHADQSFLNDYIRRNGTEWQPQRRRTTSSPPNGGSAPGLHVVYPDGGKLYIIEAGSGCSQMVSIGDKVEAMVQVEDVHATNRLDLVISTLTGEIITLESATPYHPLNTWTNGELRGRMNAHAHGYSASQGIYVHEASRQFVDILGVYVPITFEIFDNRPNIRNEPDKRKYVVEVRDAGSSKRVLLHTEYNATGIYKERVYIRFGPGYYTLSVTMMTSHGLLYEDVFQIGYNVRFLSGFGVLLWLPLLIASATILFCGTKKSNWEEEVDNDREGRSLGILGRALPS